MTTTNNAKLNRVTFKQFVKNDSLFEVRVIGNRGMFTDENNNFLFNLNGYWFTVDFGLSFNRLWRSYGYLPTDINGCGITHGHSDHDQVNGVLGQTYWIFDETGHNPHRPDVFTTEEQYDWLRNKRMGPELDNQGLVVENYCNLQVAKNGEVEVNGYTIEFIDTTDLHVQGLQSYALQITHNETGKNILYSSDIKHLEKSGLKERINNDTVAIFQDTHATGDPVHAGFNEILAYYPEEKHTLLQLMHLTGDFAQHKEVIKEKGIHITEIGEWLSFK